MNKKQTLRNFALGGLLVLPLLVASILLPESALATEVGNRGCEADTAVISCTNVNVADEGVENTGIWSILLTTLNILTAGVGVVALGGLVYGAILWTSAGGNPEQIKKARVVFTNVVIGVIAFAGMYVFLNFLVPGGVFN